MNFAALAGRLGRVDLKRRVLERYLELASDAAECGRIQTEVHLLRAIEAQEQHNLELADRQIGLALAPRFEKRRGWLNDPKRFASHDETGVVVALANLAWRAHDVEFAYRLFQRYLQLAPTAPDAVEVAKTIERLGEEFRRLGGSLGPDPSTPEEASRNRPKTTLLSTRRVGKADAASDGDVVPEELLPDMAKVVSPTAAPVTPPDASGRMEIVLANGARIIVGADVDAAAFARVVDALTR